MIGEVLLLPVAFPASHLGEEGLGVGEGPQIIFKILCYTFMQMHAFVPRHIMALTGIDKEIGLGAGFGTRIQELQGMLRHHGRIIHADDNLQLALQVLCLADATPYITSYHFQSMTGPPATPTLKTSG